MRADTQCLGRADGLRHSSVRPLAQRLGRVKSRGWSVFAIDPGETTGWAWCCVGRKELEEDYACGGMRLALKAGRVTWGEVPTPAYDKGLGRFLKWWEAEARVGQSLLDVVRLHAEKVSLVSGGAVPEIGTIVLEDFILRERTKERSLLSPVRISQSFLTLLSSSTVLTHNVELQSAATAKNTATDERLQRWGFWEGRSSHERDALRHLLTHMREQGDS